MDYITNNYKELRAFGIKKEDARYILPQATMCNLTWTMNLRSLLNFWKLRTDHKAQHEIRYLAFKTFDLVLETLPNLRMSLLKLIKEE